jgi:hypothetical protein
MSESEHLTFWRPSNCRYCNKLARCALVGGTEHPNQDDAMPRSKEFLLEQIARAKRFALAMNTGADRERFEKMAADLQNELEGAEGAEGQSSVAPNASEDAVHQTNGAAEVQPETASSDDTDPTVNAEGDQGPTTD